jgi:hypothetical protein
MTRNNTIELKPYTLTELAAMYGVCSRTFRQWLVPFENSIGQKIGRYYNINQVKTIFEKMGTPGLFED